MAMATFFCHYVFTVPTSFSVCIAFLCASCSCVAAELAALPADSLDSSSLSEQPAGAGLVPVFVLGPGFGRST